jgi:protein ImuB
MLWLCLRFHQLPLQALSRQQAATEQALVVLEKQRVLQADDAATELGIKPGTGTATVRALADNIRLLERDPLAEQRCLQQLCCWAYSISPSLYAYREDSLLLEVGSCLKLYQGLDPLLNRIQADLSCRAYNYCTGLAATPRAAWLLSHCEQDDYQQPLDQQLAPLPLRLLDEFPRQVDALAKAGLWTFGDIQALPPQALARRCGGKFSHLLQQITGTAEDRQPEFQPPTIFTDDYWFGYEVEANRELQPALQRLLQSLCQFLRNTQLQCQQLQWLLYGIKREVKSFEVRCSSPHSIWREWYQLTQLKVEQLQLDIGIEGVGLRCKQLVPGNTQARDLFSQGQQREPLHSLLDRLQNRLGLQSVEKIACRDEHLPEFAGYSSNDSHINPSADSACDGQRPFWLMPQPQALRYSRRQLYWNGRLTLLQGPERIEDNWWLDAVSRDYYVARDPQGQQYWVFRDRLQDHWYIQGVFA